MRIISGKAKGTKLYTLDGLDTRPTLDRVKESLFSILQNDIYDKNILDLFSGSGAIGLEFASREAGKVILSDNSKKAIEIISKNIEKTKFTNVTLIQSDYKATLKRLRQEELKFDIIYLDPPYDTNHVIECLNIIENLNLLNTKGICVVETDNENRIIQKIDNNNFDIYDLRKYGEIKLIFLKRKE